MTGTPNQSGGGFTPGPWEARREFSSLCIVDAQGDYIADIHDRETYDENSEIEDEEASNAEAAANACLIAAAPELLDALEAAVDAVEGRTTNLDEAICCSGHDCGCRGSSHRDLLVHGLRAAIAKARGQ